eukprot:GHVP01031335.1.p1 GENE.GHVP01031335.1~~GHVP01031335.1.p1  ORF type:complete len:1298 (-),score=318.46 GHVP01031335.1:60-3953(-)
MQLLPIPETVLDVENVCVYQSKAQWPKNDEELLEKLIESIRRLQEEANIRFSKNPESTRLRSLCQSLSDRENALFIRQKDESKLSHESPFTDDEFRKKINEISQKIHQILPKDSALNDIQEETTESTCVSDTFGKTYLPTPEVPMDLEDSSEPVVQSQLIKKMIAEFESFDRHNAIPPNGSPSRRCVSATEYEKLYNRASRMETLLSQLKTIPTFNNIPISPSRAEMQEERRKYSENTYEYDLRDDLKSMKEMYEATKKQLNDEFGESDARLSKLESQLVAKEKKEKWLIEMIKSNDQIVGNLNSVNHALAEIVQESFFTINSLLHEFKSSGSLKRLSKEALISKVEKEAAAHEADFSKEKLAYKDVQRKLQDIMTSHESLKQQKNPPATSDITEALQQEIKKLRSEIHEKNSALTEATANANSVKAKVASLDVLNHRQKVNLESLTHKNSILQARIQRDREGMEAASEMSWRQSRELQERNRGLVKENQDLIAQNAALSAERMHLDDDKQRQAYVLDEAYQVRLRAVQRELNEQSELLLNQKDREFQLYKADSQRELQLKDDELDAKRGEILTLEHLSFFNESLVKKQESELVQLKTNLSQLEDYNENLKKVVQENAVTKRELLIIKDALRQEEKENSRMSEKIRNLATIENELEETKSNLLSLKENNEESHRKAILELQISIQELRQDKERMTEKLSILPTKEQEITKLSNRNEVLIANLQEREKELFSLKSEIKNFQESHKESQNDKHELQIRFNEVKFQHQNCSKEIAELKKELEKINILSERNSSLQILLSQKENRIKEISILKDDLSKDLLLKENKIKEILKDLEALREKEISLNEQNGSLLKNLEIVKAKNEELLARIEHCENTMANQMSEFSIRIAELTQETEHSHESSAKIAKMALEIEKLNFEIQKKGDLVSELQKSVASLEILKSEKSVTIVNLEKLIVELRTKISDLELDANGVDSKLEELRKENEILSSLKDKAKESDRQKGDLEKSLSDFKTKYQKVNEEYSNVLSQKEKIELELKDLKLCHAELERAKAEAEEMIEALNENSEMLMKRNAEISLSLSRPSTKILRNTKSAERRQILPSSLVSAFEDDVPLSIKNRIADLENELWKLRHEHMTIGSSSAVTSSPSYIIPPLHLAPLTSHQSAGSVRFSGYSGAPQSSFRSTITCHGSNSVCPDCYQPVHAFHCNTCGTVVGSSVHGSNLLSARSSPRDANSSQQDGETLSVIDGNETEREKRKFLNAEMGHTPGMSTADTIASLRRDQSLDDADLQNTTPYVVENSSNKKARV